MGFGASSSSSLFFCIQFISIPWLETMIPGLPVAFHYCARGAQSEKLLFTTSRLPHCFQPGKRAIQEGFFPGFVLCFKDIKAAICSDVFALVLICLLALSPGVAKILHETCCHYTIK